MNKVKNAYLDGVCPDCGNDIPDDVNNGDTCANCGHAFYEVEVNGSAEIAKILASLLKQCEKMHAESFDANLVDQLEYPDYPSAYTVSKEQAVEKLVPEELRELVLIMLNAAYNDSLLWADSVVGDYA